jgi:fumarate reductase subunit C
LDQIIIEGVIGRKIDGHKSKVPAKLDFIQSATGLFLALFMWGHMFFVSSILVSEEWMYTVTKFFEGSLFGIEEPLIVSFVVVIIATAFIVHAGVAIRKFPKSFKQHKAYRSHMKMMKHGDTNLWFIQAVTGFTLLFLGSIHLYTVLMNPSDIGPYASADRIVSDMMLPFYVLLLLAVELHGTIGLYRLAVKWISFKNRNTRERIRVLSALALLFLIVHGSLTLVAYREIGMKNIEEGRVGEKYTPVTSIEKGE